MYVGLLLFHTCTYRYHDCHEGTLHRLLYRLCFLLNMAILTVGREFNSCSLSFIILIFASERFLDKFA